ncbi:MAG: cysteine-rich CWC family protein [Burkholderiales bacterium]|nr:cysteine-rich CWC family protein [Burkholderiales bacterium]
MTNLGAAGAAACARCSAAFRCGVNDEEPCWCSRIKLSATTLAELEKRYRWCLCSECLVALQEKEPGNSSPA